MNVYSGAGEPPRMAPVELRSLPEAFRSRLPAATRWKRCLNRWAWLRCRPARPPRTGAWPRAATARKAADEVFDYSSIAGGESGLGGRYDFDPMNFAGRYPGMVPWFREAELKHGRMCMLASIGMVVPAFVRVPGAPLWA